MKTAKYTWWNFIPKSLFEQFRRIANFYFLILAVVQLVGYYGRIYASAFSGIPVLGTLALVIFFTMIIQLRDDIRRHIKDREVNTKPHHVVRGGQVLKIQSKCGASLSACGPIDEQTEKPINLNKQTDQLSMEGNINLPTFQQKNNEPTNMISSSCNIPSIFQLHNELHVP